MLYGHKRTIVISHNELATLHEMLKELPRNVLQGIGGAEDRLTRILSYLGISLYLSIYISLSLSFSLFLSLCIFHLTLCLQERYLKSLMRKKIASS